MKLYLHFGIYKAGSSYLQYVCIINKRLLEKEGFLFPDSDDDHKMIAGKISKGNAGNLSEHLKFGRIKKVENQLLKWVKKAKHKKLNKILISAEAMVHQLAREEGIELFLRSCSKVGIKKVHAMGYFRDLVDHSLSTYKHRAKTGRYPNFRYWLKNHYETPDLLNNLIKYHRKYPIEWTFRKFRKDSDFMIESFFMNWLNIVLPQKPEIPHVNQSVTISEVLVMNEVKRIYPNITDYFVDKFISLEKEKKNSDRENEERFQIHSANILKNKNDVLIEINKYMPTDEKLSIISENVDIILNNNKNECNIIMSQYQVEELIKSIKYFSSIRGIVILLRRKIKHQIFS